MKNRRSGTAVALGVFGLLALVRGVARAEDYPLWAWAPVCYMIGGGGRGYEGVCDRQQVGQDPGGDPEDPRYDGCRTGQGHGFVHAHFSDFPVWSYNEQLDPPSWVWVTAAMSDDYWDSAYNIESNGWHFLSGSTLTRNCHGFATGWDVWVGDVGPIISDDWSLIQDGMPKASCIHSLWLHSWKVPEIYVTDPPPIPWGWDRSEKVRIEKNGSSGVYFFDDWFPREMVDGPYYE